MHGFPHQPIKFGGKSYVITKAVWDKDRSRGVITFEDDNGIQHTAFTDGMRPDEQRAAVLDVLVYWAQMNAR